LTIKSRPQARTAAIKAARQKDSQDKRQRALVAIQALETTGAPITFTAVAKTARVSAWLVYTEGIREHIEAARRRQADHDIAATPSPILHRQQTTQPDLRTDLAVARDEIRRLRAEHDKLRKRLRLHLGAEIEGPDRAQLIGRVAELEAVNRQLVAQRDARTVEADAATRRIAELEDELCAARESLRRIIREHNRRDGQG
jgi:hypothetical protein